MEVHRGGLPLAVIAVSEHMPLAAGSSKEMSANRTSTVEPSRASHGQQLYSFPAFAKETYRLSGPLVETAWSAFVHDDGYDDGRGEKRTKFTQDSGSWRFAKRSPSSDAENHVREYGMQIINRIVVENAVDQGEAEGDVRNVTAFSTATAESTAENGHRYEFSAHPNTEWQLSMPPPPPRTEARELYHVEARADMERSSTSAQETCHAEESLTTPPIATTH
jgi:hypothetical protein